MNPNEPINEPITEITEAPMEAKEALIDTNDTDIQPISFSIEDLPKEQSTIEQDDILEKITPTKNQELNVKSKPSRKHRKL